MKIGIVVILLLALSGYASETLKGVKKDFESFKQKMSASLDAAEVRLKQIKTDAVAHGSSARAEAAHELEKTRQDLESSLKGAKADSESGWRKFKMSFAESVDQLNTKIQRSLEDKNQ